jgi:hypothetical protein
MVRLPATFVALEGLEPGPAVSARLVGERLVVGSSAGLRTLDVGSGHLGWQVSRQPPSPARYQAPRSVRSAWRTLWADGQRILQLLDVEEGVAAIAHDVSSGREQWRHVLPTPAALPWTEPAPAFPGAETEVLSAFLAATSAPAVVVARTTRRTTRWPDFPAPELQAQLDVTCLDADGGRVAWTAQHPGVEVPILEKERFEGWFTRDGQLLGIDWGSGAPQPIARLAGDPGWPRRVGGRVAAVSRRRGELTLELFDVPSGRLLRRATWARKGVRATRLFDVGSDLVLQLNEQYVSLLAEDGRPRWEVRVTPHVYGVAARPGGPVLVCTSGHGGGVHGFDREAGDERLSIRLPGGAWEPREVDGTGLTAFVCGQGLALVDGLSGRHVLVELAGAQRIAGTLDGRVVVLAGAPRPGVAVVDVR